MTTARLSTSLKQASREGLGAVRQMVTRAWNFAWSLRSAAAKQRSRRRLAELDDRMLEDIGISREQAEREAKKAFWE